MRARTSVTLVAIAVLAALECQAEDKCGKCHPDVKTRYATSVHVKEFGCTGCHGGDPASLTLDAHSVTMGYVGKPSRADTPAICASCHADPKRMKSFGLPTDQYTQYRTSGHGLHLEKGDTRVAVCTDCHGSHEIIFSREPASPASRQNILSTCGRCHSDQALMAEYDLPADQVEKFRQSVHGKALLVDNHPSAPTCTGCHGAHGALAPHVGSIGAVCGHCHARTREYFREGPHRQAADEGKMSECVSCHGYHDAANPDSTLFDTTCGGCHPPDSPAFAAGQKIKTMISRAGEALESAAADMARVEPLFPRVVRYRPRFLQAYAYLLEALPVQHSLATDQVDDLTRNARSIAEEVQASVHGVEQGSSLRYIVLAVGWVFILFTAGVAYLYLKETRLDREKGPGVAGER